MKATWIPIAIILLSLGVLEVMSERVRVDEPSPAAWRAWDAPAPSGVTRDDLRTLGLAPDSMPSSAPDR